LSTVPAPISARPAKRGEACDAVERIGRVHRHFDQREASGDKRIADILDFVRASRRAGSRPTGSA
jgi:hypothetical protein